MKIRCTIEVEIDDQYLAAHDGSRSAPPNDVESWIQRDLEAAILKGIASIDSSDDLDAEIIT